MKLTFHGGAKSVTGANHLLEFGDTRILVDCGLIQGSRAAQEKNALPWAYDPSTVDALFITHGHADHMGRVPKLCKDGFSGPIYGTPATLDLTKLNLEDSVRIIAEEAEERGTEPIYTEKDLKKSLDQFTPIDYHEQKEVLSGLSVDLLDAGHILGSTIYVFDAEGTRIVFTGDLGNPPTPLLKPTEYVDRADYVIIESAYGNRTHESRNDRKRILEETIEDTVARGGALMVPSFAIERTQEILFELNELVEHKRIPPIPIYIDSPMTIRATEIYKKYEHYYNKNARHIISTGDEIFEFPRLHMTMDRAESMKINDAPMPKMILAGSGMSTAGRILHHEKRYLQDPNSTLLIIGYQVEGTLGRKLLDGATHVRIHGNDIPVRAHIKAIGGYSAHADADGLYDFVARIEKPVRHVFTVQGESDAATALALRIRDQLGIAATAPDEKDSFDL